MRVEGPKDVDENLNAPTRASAIRVYIIYGQGGKLFSYGMVRFGERLKELGYDVVDSFPWSEPGKIIANIKEMQRRGPGKIALIGFSLGANCTTWVAKSGLPIDLLVAYDPSGGFLFVRAKPPDPIGGNVKKALCYQQVGPDLLGRAAITGNITTVKVAIPHLFVQSDEGLHQITLRALEKLK